MYIFFQGIHHNPVKFDGIPVQSSSIPKLHQNQNQFQDDSIPSDFEPSIQTQSTLIQPRSNSVYANVVYLKPLQFQAVLILFDCNLSTFIISISGLFSTIQFHSVFNSNPSTTPDLPIYSSLSNSVPIHNIPGPLSPS